MLLVDVDGVISLFGFASDRRPDGRWLEVDGMPHLISATAGEHLLRLHATYEPAWCTGWREQANVHLPPALALPGPLPCLTFDCRPEVSARWKLGGIDAFVGARPMAWLDDAFDDACRAWANARAAPTLLMDTEPQVGLTEEHVVALERWAAGLRAGSAPA